MVTVVAVAAVVYAVAAQTWHSTAETERADSAEQQAADNCATLEALGYVCPYTPPPGEKGEQGDQGKPGRGIVDAACTSSGRLVLWWSDGAVQDIGECRGDDGTDGEDGEDGVDGSTGPQGDPGPAGADGQDGTDGQDGEDGRSVEDVACEQQPDGDWRLIFYFSDGTRDDVSECDGPGPLN